jgi:hypothetical protein
LLHQTFRLYKWQVFELCCCVIFITSSLTFHDIVCKWIDDKKLPKGSLFLAFNKTGKELFESLAGCRGRGAGRYYQQAQFAVPCDLSMMLHGMRKLWSHLDEWENNTNFPPRKSPGLFRKICKTVEDCLFNTGPFASKQSSESKSKQSSKSKSKATSKTLPESSSESSSKSSSSES